MEYNDKMMVLGGDFNIYMNPFLDKSDKIQSADNTAEYRQELCSILDTLNLIDIWRNIYPQTRRYTWHSRGKASRLDYLFISEELYNNVMECDILPGVLSDHSILMVELQENDNVENRGKGFWKFNNTLLHDIEFVKRLKEILLKYRKEYEHLLDKGLVWELVKFQIKMFTIQYCSKKRKEEQNYKANLEKRFIELAVIVDRNPDTDNLQEYTTTKNELDQIAKKKKQQTQFLEVK